MAKNEQKQTLRTIDIQGKDYVQVHTRIIAFHEMYPNGSLTCKIIHQDDKTITMEATAIPDVKKPERCFNGYASEVKGVGFVNSTSHIENCDTSAKGRALGTLGIGIEESFASDHEVFNAKLQKVEIDAIKRLKPLVNKFFKLVGESQNWLKIAFDLGIVDRSKFQQILDGVFVGDSSNDINNNITRLEKQLGSKKKQLEDSEKFQQFQEEAKNQQAKIKAALEDYETPVKEG
tara:strand:- start:3288 stop:3986 length:699 start_codon:yes stop_codon:yes gene_type:complete